MATRAWGPLPTEEWMPTIETTHLWTQVIGKVRLVQAPWLNHSWSVTLYPTPTGLTTGLMPHGTEGLSLTFDFADHRLEATTTTGQGDSLALEGQSVASFYAETMSLLDHLGMPVAINPMPSEIPDAVPFDQDTTHTTYVPEHAEAWFRAILDSERVFGRFRAGFRGKVSPVHFFWGSFDLAVTRFSGRTAPAHPGGIPNFPDDVAEEAYSHEVTSVGFWPGNATAPTPIFYAYAYPGPDGFSEATVGPDAAFWLDDLGEFVLPYEAVATADDPDATLLEFLETTHAAAANLAAWDRGALECAWPHGPDWWKDRPH